MKNIEDVIARNKILEEENNVLKNLIHEENDKTDRFDERRILMLKCQVYQLEKQINILSKSLAFRKTAHTEALNTMAILSDTFRSMIQNAESRGLSPVKTLSIERSEFIRWTEMAESTRLKLIKTEDSTMNDENIKDMSEQSLLTTKFSKNASVDILDVCSGNLNHVNLKQIGQLESEMSQLYKKMVRLKESLQTNLNDVSTHSDGPKQNRSNVLPMHKENLKTQLFDCCNATKDTCASLFDLMLLVPSAPWPAVKKSPIDKLTQEKLITKLKSLGLPKTKYPQVEMLFKSYFVASNYHHHMRSNELAAAEEEIKFYRASYAAQRDYIESVMNLFMKKYEGFIEELRDNLNVPLRSLIDKFWQMKSDSTEENLKEFLGIFKHYAKKLDMVISNIESMPANDLISKTFNDLIGQLDLQVTSLSNLCQNGLEQLNLNKIDLTELSNQSDLIFSEVISLTPKTSPSHSPSASVNNLANF